MTLRLRRPWSLFDQETVGLTGVQFFDLEGRTVCLAPGNVHVVGTELIDGGDQTVGRLVDGKVRTCDPRHMWKAKLPSDGGHIDIEFYLPKAVKLGRVVVGS